MHEVERQREAAYGARTAAEAGRTELSRLVSEQRANAMSLESELKVAEERQRNALARRERADAERRSGQELGNRLAEDRDSVAQERARLEGELAQARETLAARTSAEARARDVGHERATGVRAARAPHARAARRRAAGWSSIARAPSASSASSRNAPSSSARTGSRSPRR